MLFHIHKKKEVKCQNLNILEENGHGASTVHSKIKKFR